jgi:hypothetical protein
LVATGFHLFYSKSKKDGSCYEIIFSDGY